MGRYDSFLVDDEPSVKAPSVDEKYSEFLDPGVDASLAEFVQEDEPQSYAEFLVDDDNPPVRKEPGAGRKKFDSVIGKMYQKAKGMVLEEVQDLKDSSIGKLMVGDFEGAALEQVKSVADAPGTGLAGEAMNMVAQLALTDKTAGEIAKQRLAEGLGLDSYEQLEKAGDSLGNAVRVSADIAAATVSDTAPGGQKQLKKSIRWTSKMAEAVGQRVLTDGPQMVMDAAQFFEPESPSEDNPSGEKQDISSRMHRDWYEHVTGRKWVTRAEMNELRLANPEQWQKVQNAQASFIRASGNEIGGMLTGLGTMIAVMGRAPLETVGIIDDDGVSATDMAFHIVGNALDDSMELVDDPVKALRERPLTSIMDVYAAVGAAPRLGARLEYAQKLRSVSKTRGEAAAKTAAAVVGGSIPFVPTLSRPFTKIPLNSARYADEVSRAAFAAALGRVADGSKLFRELTEYAPDMPREQAALLKELRLDKAADIEHAKRIVDDLQAELNIKDVSPDGKLSKFLDAFTAQPDRNPIESFLSVHEKALQMREQVFKKDLAGELVSDAERAVAGVAGSNPRALLELMERADVDLLFSNGVRNSIDELNNMRAELVSLETHGLKSMDGLINGVQKHVDHAKARLSAARSAGDKAMEAGIQSRLDKHIAHVERLKQMAERVKLEGDVRREAQRLRDNIKSVEDHIAALRRRDSNFFTAEDVKKHGAWLDYRGQVAGGVDVAAEIHARLRAGETTSDILNDFSVQGTHPANMGVMDRALEYVRFVSEQEQVLVNAGIMTPEMAALNMGLRWNHVKDPMRAAELDNARTGLVLDPTGNIQEVVRAANQVRMTNAMFDAIDPLPVPPKGFRPKGRTPLSMEKGYTKVNGEKMQAGYVDKHLAETGSRRGIIGRTMEGDVVPWVRLPEANKAGESLSTVNKYGKLAGMWVPLDTAVEIQKSISLTAGVWDQLASLASTDMVINRTNSHINAMLGEATVMASRGIDPVTGYGKAGLLMQGIGDDVSKAIYKVGVEKHGIMDGTSLEALDQMLGTGVGTNKGVAKAGREFMRQFVKLDESELDDAMGFGEAAANLGGNGLAWYMKNLAGWGGIKAKAWDLRDRMFRVALFDDAWRRAASWKYGFDEAGIKANLQTLLADDELGRAAVKMAHDASLDYRALPRGPRVGHSSGIYELGRKSTIYQFIAYSLKATGFWTKEMFARPAFRKAITEGGNYTWEQLDEQARERNIQLARFGDEGWTYDLPGDRGWMMKYAQPGTFLPLDIANDIYNKEVQGTWIQPLIESTLGGGRTRSGREINNRLLYVVEQLLVPDEATKFFGSIGLNEDGTLKRLTQDIRDPVTGKKYDPFDELLRYVASTKPDQAERLNAKLLAAGNHFRGAKNKAKNEYRGGNGVAGHNDYDRYLKDMKKARIELAKSIKTIAPFFASR